jgi:4,5-dihydroxyphthalate decarboxylase
MPDLKLTLACWDYDRTRPLIDGRVKPEGIDLDIEVLRPRQAFQRMLDKKEFEAIGRYLHEQGLSPRVVSADELFAPAVE